MTLIRALYSDRATITEVKPMRTTGTNPSLQNESSTNINFSFAVNPEYETQLALVREAAHTAQLSGDAQAKADAFSNLLTCLDAAVPRSTIVVKPTRAAMRQIARRVKTTHPEIQLSGVDGVQPDLEFRHLRFGPSAPLAFVEIRLWGLSIANCRVVSFRSKTVVAFWNEGDATRGSLQQGVTLVLKQSIIEAWERLRLRAAGEPSPQAMT